MTSDKLLYKMDFDKHTPKPGRALEMPSNGPSPNLLCSYPDVSIVPLRKLLLPSALFTGGGV